MRRRASKSPYKNMLPSSIDIRISQIQPTEMMLWHWDHIPYGFDRKGGRNETDKE